MTSSKQYQQEMCPTRRRAAMVLTLGVVSLSSVGVQCFAMDSRNNRWRRRSSVIQPPPMPNANGRKVPHRQRSHSSNSDSVHPENPFLLYAQERENEAEQTNAEGGDASDDTQKQKKKKPGLWPCFDEMDKELIGLSLPVIGNFAINPLIGAVDLFWVNRMGNALAVAGQAAANQIFSSAFWFTSFLPSVTATLVSKQHASGDEEGTQDAVCQALFVGFFIALIGTPLMFFNPDKALSAVLTGEFVG